MPERQKAQTQPKTRNQNEKLNPGACLAKAGDEAPVSLQAVLDAVADPIMVIGRDYRVRLMNRAARDNAPEEADPDPPFCFQVSHHRNLPCSGVKHPCPLQAVCVSRQPVTVVHKHYLASGEPRFVEIVAAPLWNQENVFEGVVESMRDISERRRVETSLRGHAERMRILTAQLADVAEAERQQLAQELHDQVGQNLTALGINLNIIRSQIPEELAPELHSRLDDSLLLVEETTERIRNLMAELRPPVLNDYGLGAALRWCGEQFSRRTGIAFAIQNEEVIPRLAPRVEIALFRIAQEALTNVTKHARASQVRVTVTLDDRLLRLEIVDDGIGFVPANLAREKGQQGWGLLTMAERAQAVGSRFEIVSASGKGTRIVLEVEA